MMPSEYRHRAGARRDDERTDPKKARPPIPCSTHLCGRGAARRGTSLPEQRTSRWGVGFGRGAGCALCPPCSFLIWPGVPAGALPVGLVLSLFCLACPPGLFRSGLLFPYLAWRARRGSSGRACSFLILPGVPAGALPVGMRSVFAVLLICPMLTDWLMAAGTPRRSVLGGDAAAAV